VRNALLAPLKDARADVEAALARFARHRRDDDDVLDALVDGLVDEAVAAGASDDVGAGAEAAIDAATAPALLRRWLSRQLARHVDDPRSSGAAVDDVLRLCAARREGAVDLKGARAEIRRVGDHRFLLALTGANPHIAGRRHR
jgi:hypothetical protein